MKKIKAKIIKNADVMTILLQVEIIEQHAEQLKEAKIKRHKDNIYKNIIAQTKDIIIKLSRLSDVDEEKEA